MEFGLQTIRRLCPCVRCSLPVPAEILSGTPGIHVAQTQPFSRFTALPRAQIAFKAFWVQNHALAAV